mgnify:CR=1 FL=1
MLRAFADLGFRWKIALPILLLAALLVAMGTLGVRGITQVAESSTTLTNRHLPAISLLLNADRDLSATVLPESTAPGRWARWQVPSRRWPAACSVCWRSPCC